MRTCPSPTSCSSTVNCRITRSRTAPIDGADHSTAAQLDALNVSALFPYSPIRAEKRSWPSSRTGVWRKASSSARSSLLPASVRASRAASGKGAARPIEARVGPHDGPVTPRHGETKKSRLLSNANSRLPCYNNCHRRSNSRANLFVDFNVRIHANFEGNS